MLTLSWQEWQFCVMFVFGPCQFTGNQFQEEAFRFHFDVNLFSCVYWDTVRKTPPCTTMVPFAYSGVGDLKVPVKIALHDKDLVVSCIHELFVFYIDIYCHEKCSKGEVLIKQIVKKNKHFCNEKKTYPCQGLDDSGHFQHQPLGPFLIIVICWMLDAHAH